MRIELEPRAEINQTMVLLSPLAAIFASMAAGALIFTLIGYDGIRGVFEIFVRPIIQPLKWQDLLAKAAPLILIGVGLSIGFRANLWNIGAEGQYVVGGLAGTGVALLTWNLSGYWILPLMILAGMAGGLAYALIPAFLKARLGISEILTSLMLTYVSVQLLYFLMNGPWQDPEGFNFPQSRLFTQWQTLPKLVSGTTIHVGIAIALLVAIAFGFFMRHTLIGYRFRLSGAAPRAARYSGFRPRSTVYLAMGLSGGLAGLAGILEAAGPFGQMVPQFPTFYGFTAIIVAFLGRLDPWGVIFSGFVLAVTYVGGDIAQTSIGLPSAATGMFQAMTLFFLLVFDSLVRFRLRISRAPAAEGGTAT